jgi:hypothetical protein
MIELTLTREQIEAERKVSILPPTRRRTVLEYLEDPD